MIFARGVRRKALDDLSAEIARLREWVEGRAQTQEGLVRAILLESTSRAAEAVEGRIQLAVAEAMAFAEHGLDRHDAAIAAFGRRLAELSRDPPPPEPPAAAAIEARDFLVGALASQGAGCAHLPLREENEAAYLADLAHLPILPGGAARLVVSGVVERVPAAALGALLVHWRSRLAPDGELVIITLDGPALARDLPALGERLGRLRQLCDAQGLVAALRAAGLEPQTPAHAPPFTLTVVARL